MNTQLILTAIALTVATVSIPACLDAMIIVWCSRYDNNSASHRAMRRLGWYWNALQWKLANIRFDVAVWLASKRQASNHG